VSQLLPGSPFKWFDELTMNGFIFKRFTPFNARLSRSIAALCSKRLRQEKLLQPTGRCASFSLAQ
jgi:hypothetical protein